MPPNKSSNVRYEDMPTRVMNVQTGGYLEEGIVYLTFSERFRNPKTWMLDRLLFWTWKLLRIWNRGVTKIRDPSSNGMKNGEVRQLLIAVDLRGAPRRGGNIICNMNSMNKGPKHNSRC